MVEIRVKGHWGDARSADVLSVLKSVKDCAADLSFLNSEFAPKTIAVKSRPDLPYPMVLYDAKSKTEALVFLSATGKFWSQIAYQFGHELGHIIANNWGSRAKIIHPSHWIEETLVEAFGVSGLFRMAEQWRVSPPHRSWIGYAQSLEDYAIQRLQVLINTPTTSEFNHSPTEWLAQNIVELSNFSDLQIRIVGPLVANLVDAFNQLPSPIADLSHLNTWPDRSSLPIKTYLSVWYNACVAGGSAGDLPDYIMKLFDLL